MTVVDRLCAFARGDVTAARAVLHNCRTAGFGATAYGREEGAALFRAMPLDLNPGDAVVSDETVALFGNDADGIPAALFADVHDGQIMRLWALGSRQHDAGPVDATHVPVDLDLDQRGGAFDVVAVDHPALDPNGAEALRRLGQDWIDGQPRDIFGPVGRARPILLRAASGGGRSAALMMVQGLTPTKGVARFAVGVLIGDAGKIVVDAAGRAAGLACRRVVELRPADGNGAGAAP